MRHWLRGGLVATALVAGSIGVLPTQHADAASGFTFTRLAGANRFGTAADIAIKSFGTAPTVLIARADLFPDALAGGYLAGSTGSGAPILLTRTDSLPQETADALNALGANKAILLGGLQAINANVEAGLRARNNGTFQVERIGGADRFDTARLVAEKPGAANVGTTDNLKTAIVASGRNFPDALAGSPASYAGRLPTLLTEPGTLSQQARTALTNLAIKRVYLLGGTAAISDAVQSAISSMGIEVVRLSGADRQATAVAIAESLAIGKLGFTNTHINLARGDDFADALTFGPHAGKERAVMVLTGNPTTLTATTRDYLILKSPTLVDGHIAGGPAAVSDSVLQEATAAATGTANAVTVDVPNKNVAPGSNISGTITGNGINGVTVTGCGITNPQTVERTNQGAFSFAIPANATGTTCELTFTSTLAGGGTETDRVTVTLSSAAFTVSGTQAAQELNTTRQCTAAVPSGQVVTIMLLPTGNITNGNLFKDSAGAANQADEDVTNAKITNVNGTAVNPAVQKVVSTTSSGSITFSISSATPDDVTAVVFANPAGGNGILDLVAPATANANPKAPSEAFGVGCRTVFVPAEASTGAGNPTVTTVNRDLDFFTGNDNKTYNYDSGDTFQFGGQPLTMAQFEGALTPGDVLTVSYAPDATGTSVFNITNDTVSAPTNVVATPGNFDNGAANNDVRITFDPPAGNGPGTSYIVERGTVTSFGPDNACGGGDDVAPVTFTNVGTATVANNPTTGQPQGSINDLNPGTGCFVYRVTATNAGTNRTASTSTTGTTVPGAADNAAPTITDVRAQDNSAQGRVSNGDVHRFIFSEAMATTSDDNGVNYAISDASATPTTAQVTCGADGTTCQLNATAVTIGGVSRAANTVLTVTVGNITASGGDNFLDYPVTITAIGPASQVRDTAGNALTLAGSDVTVQADPAFPAAT